MLIIIPCGLSGIAADDIICEYRPEAQLGRIWPDATWCPLLWFTIYFLSITHSLTSLHLCPNTNCGRLCYVFTRCWEEEKTRPEFWVLMLDFHIILLNIQVSMNAVKPVCHPANKNLNNDPSSNGIFLHRKNWNKWKRVVLLQSMHQLQWKWKDYRSD